MQRESQEMPDRQPQLSAQRHAVLYQLRRGGCSSAVRADAKFCPCTPCKPDDYREVLRCLLYVPIEQLNLNKKKSEIQMLLSKLIGNRMQLERKYSGPNSGLSYDPASPI